MAIMYRRVEERKFPSNHLLAIVALIVILLGGLFWRLFVFKAVPPEHPAVTYARVRSDLEDMGEAFHFLCSQAGVENVESFYDGIALELAIGEFAQSEGIDAFRASVEVYSRTLSALLSSGGNVLDTLAGSEDPTDSRLTRVFNTSILPGLRTNYVRQYRTDPWGNAYLLFLGPWPEELGPIPFRCYARESPMYGGRFISHRPEPYARAADNLTCLDSGIEHGIPAPEALDLYIWSCGANGISDQARYDPSHIYAPPPQQHYRQDAPKAYWGGGDDINNWDPGDSSFVFYAP